MTLREINNLLLFLHTFTFLLKINHKPPPKQHLQIYLKNIILSFTHRHLAKNPFICDCNLRWLADYLHKNPIETSGARCESPKRMHRRRIETLREEKFKCELFCFCLLQFKHGRTCILMLHAYASLLTCDQRNTICCCLFFFLWCLGSWDEMRMKLSGECRLDTDCPAQCQCDGSIVDCSGRGLKEIPRDIPLHTTEL